MSDTLEMITRHIQGMHWIAKRAYLVDRGYERRGEFPNREWISPHNGEAVEENSALTHEMLLEFEGRPTPRSGKILDPVRGEVGVKDN